MEPRIALITGAGSGIGRAVALTLAAKGYRLVLIGRKLEALTESAALAGLNASDVLCHTADITSKAAVDAAFDATVATFGRLDLLFNNAGISAPARPLEELSEADWRGVIDTNVSGSFFCVQAAFRVMKAQSPQGGRIINNGSISAVSPRPNSAPYTASKHAITGLTKSASLDGRAFNIACGQIDIGNTASDMGNKMALGVLQANGTMMAEPVMDLSNVGEGVAYMDSLPLNANVQFMTVMATAMPFIGRG